MKWKKNWTFSSKLEKNSFIYKHFAFQWTNSRGKYNFKNFSNFFRKLLTMKIWLIRFDKNANPNPEIIIDSRSNKFLTKIRINYTFIFFLFFLFSRLQTVSFKWFRFRVTRLSTRPRWPSFEFQLIQIYPRVSSPCHRVNKTFHGTIATKILLCP